MSDRDREALALSGWPGGLNVEVAPGRLEPTQLRRATNFVIGPVGELVVREGYRSAPEWLYDDLNVVSSEPSDWAQPQWLYSWLDPGDDYNESFIIMFGLVNGGGVDEVRWIHADGTWEDPGVATGSVGLVQFASAYHIFPQAYVMNDKAYVSVPGATNPRTFELDGSGPTVTTLTDWDPDTDGSKTSGFHPIGCSHIIAYERVFVAYPVWKDATLQGDYPSRIHFSEPLDPLDWDVNNYFDVNPDDQQQITRLEYFADQIVVFKEHSVYGIIGSDFEGLSNQIYNIDPAIGTTAPATVVNTGPLLFFWDPGRGVYVFDGSAFTKISDAIDPLLPQDRDATAIGWYRDERYHLSIGLSDGEDFDNVETFVFDTKTTSWTRWDRGWSWVTAGSSEESKHYAVSRRLGSQAADATDFIYELGGHSDGGDAIEASALTGWISPTGGFLSHRIRQMLVARRSSAADITVKLFLDGGNAAVATATLSEIEVAQGFVSGPEGGGATGAATPAADFPSTSIRAEWVGHIPADAGYIATTALVGHYDNDDLEGWALMVSTQDTTSGVADDSLALGFLYGDGVGSALYISNELTWERDVLFGVRVDYDVATRGVDFYYSTDGGVTWTLHQSVTATRDPADPGESYTVHCVWDQSESAPYATAYVNQGKFVCTRASIDYDGTEVCNPDFAADGDGWVPGDSEGETNDDAAGNTWTLHGHDTHIIQYTLADFEQFIHRTHSLNSQRFKSMALQVDVDTGAGASLPTSVDSLQAELSTLRRRRGES